MFWREKGARDNKARFEPNFSLLEKQQPRVPANSIFVVSQPWLKRLALKPERTGRTTDFPSAERDTFAETKVPPVSPAAYAGEKPYGGVVYQRALHRTTDIFPSFHVSASGVSPTSNNPSEISLSFSSPPSFLPPERKQRGV